MGSQLLHPFSTGTPRRVWGWMAVEGEFGGAEREPPGYRSLKHL